jgi:hypothetical protein
MLRRHTLLLLLTLLRNSSDLGFEPTHYFKRDPRPSQTVSAMCDNCVFKICMREFRVSS